jgi:tetratricopeptide (TPR) repeat protein
MIGRVTAIAFVVTACLFAAAGALAAESDDLEAQHQRNVAASARLVELGDAAMAQRDVGGALDMYERALVADPASVSALKKLGFAYESVHLYTDEMKYCRMALALEPDDVEALGCQGVGAAHREEFELAVDNLKRIKELCGKHCPEYKALYRALKQNFPVRYRRIRR